MVHRNASRDLWRVVFWVSFPFGILSFVLPIYSRELGATALEVGALFTVMSPGPAVVRPFLGRALDRWGRRPFLLSGLTAHAVSMLLVHPGADRPDAHPGPVCFLHLSVSGGRR